MVSPSSRSAAIVGVGLSDYPIAPDLSATQHHVLAAKRALADAGLRLSDVDGYACAGSGSWGTNDLAPFMADVLGVRYRYLDGTFAGGSSFEYHVQHAAAAIEAGLCETVLITYGSDQYSALGTQVDPGSSGPVFGAAQLEAPYGLPLMGAYALCAKRHMHEFGTTSEQLAQVAVDARAYAAMNPNARYKNPLSVRDVLSSSLLADPLHMLDCCVVTDGGGAVVLTTRERARDLLKPPVHVLAATTAQTHWTIGEMPDYTTSAAPIAAAEAFARAGLKPQDIDVAQIYDSFTITVLMLLEGLGFCGRGEGGPFVADGNIGPGGSLPTNTDGGGLSSCHPGMRGIFLLVEAVRQLRGEAGMAQVRDAEVALAAGVGGYLSGIGVVMLSREVN
jgi:acetyl-CoA acetyltransferase